MASTVDFLQTEIRGTRPNNTSIGIALQMQRSYSYVHLTSSTRDNEGQE